MKNKFRRAARRPMHAHQSQQQWNGWIKRMKLPQCSCAVKTTSIDGETLILKFEIQSSGISSVMKL